MKSPDRAQSPTRQSPAALAARALARRIETLARHLLGEPVWQGPAIWRFGRHGSLIVNVAGERRGRWYSFQDKRGGDALDLVAFARRSDVRSALAFAKAWLGGTR